MNKQKYNEWVLEAERALQKSEILQGDKINKSYNGQVAALGISIFMSGLLPTIAIYYQDYDANDSKSAHRRCVLNIIARMVMKDDNKRAKELFQKVLELESSNDLKELSKLKTDIIDSSVALKQVIRTYTLLNDGEKGDKNGN